MRQGTAYVFVLVVSSSFLTYLNAATCEETEVAHVKLELAQQSINNVKDLHSKCQDENDDSSNCSLKHRSLAYLNAALDLIMEAKVNCTPCPVSKRSQPADCSDVLNDGFNRSGVYQIWPRIRGEIANDSLLVYCDMNTDGGGWTVIQRRGKFPRQVDFYETWEAYKTGFGNIKQEFWLGNEHIFALTNQRNYSVRFDMVDAKDEYRYAQYDTFSIGDEKSGYVLNIENHSGNATDDMAHHNEEKFSTKDKQNDKRYHLNACTKSYESGFWFSNGCGNVNLNGVYLEPGKVDDRGIWWHHWKDRRECLSSTEIKIRQKILTQNTTAL